ncbi:MAG: hypothetical protein EOP06_00485 [Proteobacteria bacterium]|nr:MAG: hypothetical protein EOP06_00485 [Pseudomonadota bacterium]
MAYQKANVQPGTLVYLYQNAGVPVAGTSGTFAKVAPKGALLVDTTNAILYINTNTQASPTWTKVGTQT